MSRLLSVVALCVLIQGGLTAMELTSSAFRDGGNIPPKYSCDGADISPPLAWKDVPAGTQSLALIVEDPDAPSGVFAHWVVFGIPPTAEGLAENASKAGMPAGAKQGRNSAGRTGWFGPCPPSGAHHYVFTLYAVNVEVDLKTGAERSDVDNATRGHVLAETKLTGLYSRQKK
jgi:Raf kinase inhibitor-like YbhB/YbcL family protein